MPAIKWGKLLMNSFYYNLFHYNCNTTIQVDDQVNLEVVWQVRGQVLGQILRNVMNHVKGQVWWHVRRTIDENI
jgi:predicted oxidoreductase (fatty acid repression mutant protein)